MTTSIKVRLKKEQMSYNNQIFGILDKVASDTVASGQSSLLRKVASTVNKGHGRSARLWPA